MTTDNLAKTILGMAAVVCLLTQCKLSTNKVGELPKEPDYADFTQWYVDDRQGEADIFYIVSTETGDYNLPDGQTCHFADTYNDSTRTPIFREMLGVDTLISGRLNYYSPYYRQCSLQTFTDESTKKARMPIAIDDVRRAFKYYLEKQNNGRPFILAGFSQGASILLQLLEEMDDKTYGRMVAAYAIGASITDDMLKENKKVVPAKGASDVGVTICYNSVRDTTCTSLTGKANKVAINPVNWKTDQTPAVLITEPTPLKLVAEQKKDTLTVRLDTKTKLLCVEGYTATDYVLPMLGKEGDYHSREIWLYRDQLRGNIARRVAAFKQKK